MRNTLKFYIGLGVLALFVLSSCNPVTFTDKTDEIASRILSTKTDIKIETSIKIAATLTNTSSITPITTNTIITTETLTNNCNSIILNTNPYNIELYAKLTVDDVTSGCLSEANYAIAKPFPEIAQRIAWTDSIYGLGIGGGPLPFLYIHYVDDVYFNYKQEIDELPQKWISFNRIRINQKDVIIAGLQIINKDGGYGILNVVLDDRPIDEFITTDNWKAILLKYNKKNMEGKVIYSFILDCKIQPDFMRTTDTCEYYQKHPEITTLLDQWLSTKILPVGLERLILGVFISRFWTEL